MHRIDSQSATPEKKFTGGSPSGSVPATVVTPDWLNDVQENICYVIETRGLTLVKGDKTQLLQAILSAVQPTTPTGSAETGQISSFGQATPPSGWLKCNGAAISRSVYSALFAAIGVTYGSGDGSTTFNLPDARGRFVRVLDDGKGIDSSRKIGSTQGSQNLAHTHTTTFVREKVDAEFVTVGGNAVLGDQMSAGLQTIATSSSGGGEARPNNIAFPLFIKY